MILILFLIFVFIIPHIQTGWRVPSGESGIVGIVGIDPFKALLLNGYNRVTEQMIKSFRTDSEAKEWLIQP